MDMAVVASCSWSEDLCRTHFPRFSHEVSKAGMVGADRLSVEHVDIEAHTEVVARTFRVRTTN